MSSASLILKALDLITTQQLRESDLTASEINELMDYKMWLRSSFIMNEKGGEE